MTVDRCPKDGYKLVSGLCPICRWEAPVEMPFLPAEVRALRVSREMFITPQHYMAWLAGTPLRRHLERRKKIGRDERDTFARFHNYQCADCPSTSMLTLDHIVPQILGGSSLFANLAYRCEPHNRAQWQRYAAYLRELDAYLKAVA